jgi:hypothetical protein
MPARRTDTPALGRRIRAALVLAGRTPQDVAPELNISSRTLERTIQGQRMAREWEIDRLAELLAVPDWFLRDGFAGAPPAGADAEVERAIGAAVTRALDQLVDQFNLRVEAASAQHREGSRLEVGPEDRPREPRPGGGPAGLQ